MVAGGFEDDENLVLPSRASQRREREWNDEKQGEREEKLFIAGVAAQETIEL